jgi:hypothetical protein
MFEYQYYLDTTLFSGVDVPIKDIEKFEEVIERDYQLRGILIKYPQRISFKGLAYDYIKSVRDSDTFCGSIDFKLLVGRENSSFYEYQVGIIYISTAIFDLNNCLVECEVLDNSYFATIKNNYKCEAYLGSDKSKNGIDITPTPQISIDTYVPSTGAVKRNVYGYDVYESLKFLVQFMTDGVITFQSDYFEDTSATDYTQGIGSNLIALLRCRALRDSSADLDIAGVYTTFEKVWTNIAKINNLWFVIIKESDGSLTMKAERYDYFLKANTQHNLRWSQDLELSFVDTELYATVNLGSETSDYSQAGTDYLGYIPSLTMKSETYNVEGQCNADNSLSVSSSIVTDHNVIAFQLMDATADTNFDDELCFLSYNEYNTGVQYRATLYDLLNLGTYPQYYNRYFTNSEVAQMTDFHGALRKDNSPGAVLFNANITGSSYNAFVTSQIMPFNNETLDEGNDFDTATYKWTCPADGFYVFSGFLTIGVSSFPSQNFSVKPTITPNIAPAFNLGTAYNPIGDFWSINFFEGASFNLAFSFGQFYNAGDIEWLDLTLQNLSGNVPFNLTYTLDFSRWNLDYSVNGGILKPDDRNKILINKFTLKNNISYDDWKLIRDNLDNPFQLFLLPDEAIKVWIKTIKREVLTGNIEAEFLTNNDNY